MQKVRDFLFWLFKKSLKLVVGKGISQRSPLAERVFFFLYRNLSPRIILAEFEGVKLHLDSMSGFSRALLARGYYEKGTTRVFRDLIKEGTVVVDIGAYVGYYSLIAARLVGQKGAVYAFEPAPDNFTLLIKNIEVNEFHNIVAVQKAVSNKTGRDRLFLSSDPTWHSMYDRHEKESIDVEVTSIDHFFQNIIRPVDLVKIDAEGSEMKVLEGMLETIKGNPSLKIITEFSPGQLQRSGSSPEEFLRNLVGCGFKIYLINEEAQTTKFTTIDDIMESYQEPRITNLLCER